MAKQIKALKCPQCGSVKKEELKPDYYRCSNCGTEYFLDNDDININVRHTVPPVYQSKPINKKLLIGLFIAAGFFFVILPIFFSIFSASKSGNSSSTSSIAYVRDQSKVNESIQEQFVLPGKDGQPIVAFRIQRRYYGRDSKQPDHVLRFYDPIQNKILKTIEMKDWDSDTYLYYNRFFSDGNFYVIPKKQQSIYKMDAQKLSFTKMDQTFFEPVPELSSGIAKLEFRSESYGDGLEIMTNDGTQYYYYPLVQRLFKGREELDKAYDKIYEDSSMPTKVYFTFTDKSIDYKDEKIQLIKYWYRERLGDLKKISYKPNWHKKYHYPKGSGIYIGSVKYEKVLFDSKRIPKFEDLTPGRLYFEPEIVFQNSESLYITGFPTANTEGDKFLQKIDINSGKIIWTYRPQLTEYRFIDDFYRFKNGIAFELRGERNGKNVNLLLFIDDGGKVIKEIDLNNLFKNQ